jgi:multicomponent Na+:H+ antiporter subunit D
MAGLGTTTPGGYLLVLAIVLPLAGMIISFVLGGRNPERVALGSTPFGFALACAIAFDVGQAGKPIVYTIGGLPPPLGIALRADGISAVMLVAAAVIVTAAALYARAKFATPNGVRESRSSLTFWIMLQAIWAALTIIFVGSDLFNLYVAWELLTFAAVPLVCIDGRPETLAAALRYLLFALFGSISYLLGVALFYGVHGTLDIALLSQRVQATPVVWTAAALMTAGLLAKTALFPLHLWLPPAHANAPAAASAVLSGLVVKGSFFLTLRLWFYVLPALPTDKIAAVLGWLGSAAVIAGSIIALRQARLKLLIAYSTVAQIGYLFLIFPLAAGAQAWSAIGWSAGLMQVLAHAFAKAAMFFSARPARRSARPRPDRKTRRRSARPAFDLPDHRPWGIVAHGPAAARRLHRQMADAASFDRIGPMAVDASYPRRQPACGRLRLPHSCARVIRRPGVVEIAAEPQPRDDCACSNNDRHCARLRAADVLRFP